MLKSIMLGNLMVFKCEICLGLRNNMEIDEFVGW